MAKTDDFLLYVKRTTNYVSYEEMAADVAEYLERMGAENLTLLAYYEELGLSKYVRIDDDGTRHYNKEAIREILTRQNAKDVSKEEYAALILLLDTMNTKDPQGNIVPDLELLELLIDCGYTGTVDEAGLGYTYTPTPAFKTLCALYERHVDDRIRENPALLYNEKPENALARQTLLSDMIKAVLLSEMVAKHPIVQVYEADIELDAWAKTDPFEKTIPPDITEALGTKVWENSGKLGFYDITAKEFSFRNYDDILALNELDAIRAMYRDKNKEMLETLGGDITGEILDLAVEFAAKKIPIAGVIVAVGQGGFDLANISCEVDEFNKDVNEQEENTQQRRVLKAMRAGLIVTTHDGTVSVHGVCIDERELQIAVNRCNNDPANNFNSLDIGTLEKEFYKMGATGEKSDIVEKYVNWCLSHEDQINKYRVELQDVLAKYMKQYPDCPYNKLEDLTPAQINELDKNIKTPIILST